MTPHLMMCNGAGQWSVLATAPVEQLVPIFERKIQQFLDEGYVIAEDWRIPNAEGASAPAVVFSPNFMLCIGMGFTEDVRRSQI